LRTAPAGQQRRVFANAENVSSRTGDALLMSEFGATNDTSILSEVVSEAANDKVGWLMWACCDCGDPAEGLVNNAAATPASTTVVIRPS
jgi:endoglycosylceramidase